MSLSKSMHVLSATLLQMSEMVSLRDKKAPNTELISLGFQNITPQLSTVKYFPDALSLHISSMLPFISFIILNVPIHYSFQLLYYLIC